jgi:hypothetical protein
MFMRERDSKKGMRTASLQPHLERQWCIGTMNANSQLKKPETS